MPTLVLGCDHSAHIPAGEGEDQIVFTWDRLDAPVSEEMPIQVYAVIRRVEGISGDELAVAAVFPREDMKRDALLEQAPERL